MSFLWFLCGVGISIAMIVLPAMGIAAEYGDSVGWFCGIVLMALTSISYGIRDIVETLRKDKK
ncbi:MAG: hypothetical protein V4621_02700 [Pseudomonadota bacterium]